MYRYTSQDDKIIYMQVALLKSLDQLPGPDLHAGPMPVGTDAIPAATAALGPRPLPRHNKVFPAIAQAVASLLLLLSCGGENGAMVDAAELSSTPGNTRLAGYPVAG